MRRAGRGAGPRVGKRPVAECGGLSSAQKRRRASSSSKPIEINLSAEGTNSKYPPSALRDNVVVLNIDDSVEGEQGRGNIDYAPEIFSYYSSVETTGRPNPVNWLDTQKEVTSQHRAIAIDWLMEVVQDWKLRRDTLHLSVNLMDRYLASVPVPKEYLQLVAITALWIASKFIEVHAPSSEACAAMTGNTYTANEVRKTELHVLRVLEYDLSVPTAGTYVERYLRASSVDMADPEVGSLARFLVDASLLDMAALAYRPSALAAAAVFVARYRLANTAWTPTLRRHTGYALHKLPACCEALLVTWRWLTGQRFQGMLKRFSRPGDHWVTKIRAVEAIPKVVFQLQ